MRSTDIWRAKLNPSQSNEAHVTCTSQPVVARAVAAFRSYWFGVVRRLSLAATQWGRTGRREDDLTQMTVTWRAQGRPPPTEKEMKSLLDEKIRQEVLYREALKLGLDKDDTIVRRRMVQKMDFLADDLSDLREPSRDELKAWF